MKQLDASKRQSLLNIAATSGTIGMLAVWEQPIIKSVILPAHAQTSAADVSCGSETAIEMNNSSDQDLVVLSFDPSGSCQLTASQSSGEGFNAAAFGGNIIVAIDAGTNPVINWDTEVAGDTNWQVTPDLGQDNTSSGQFNLVATRLNAPSAGQVFNVQLSVTLSGTDLTSSTIIVSAQVSPA